MKRLYPVILKQHENVVLVRIPDLGINTEGKNMYDAIEMARDAIGLQGICLEDDKLKIPEPSSFKKILTGDGEIKTLVDIDYKEYRRKVDMKKIRKNVTISSWLSKEAEQRGINFSHVLEKALQEIIYAEEQE